MHIIYIHQHFCTNQGSSGTRSLDVSRHMVRLGHKVTMICGLLDVSGLKPMPWYRLFRREKLEGIHLIVCNVPYTNHMGAMKRIGAFLWFAFLATIAAVFMTRRPDLVFATSTPLTVGIPGYLTGRLRRIPFIFEVRDIWPEAFVISGELKPGLMVNVAQRLEEFLYNRAERILLVSPGFEERLVERGFLRGKMKTILLGADGDLFRDAQPDPEFRRRYGLEGKTLSIFTGAHGPSNGLDYVMAAAEHLKDRGDIAFVFLGEGREKPRLKELAREKGLTNTLFLDAVPKTALPGILTSCDIGLMILLHVGRPRPVTPNKIFDYMFAGLPSVVNFPGCTWEMVERDGAGVGSDPLDPGDLARRVAHWADHPDERKRIGAHSRDVAYAKYSRDAIAEQLLGAFGDVLAARRRRGA